MLLRTMPVAAFGVALLVLGLVAWHSDEATTAAAATNCDAPSTNWDTDQQALFTLINQERANHGILPLKPSPSLNASAAWYSYTTWYTHVDPTGRPLAARLKDCDYSGWDGPVAESHAQSDKNHGSYAASVMAQLTGSGSDDAALLGDYKVIGIGFEQGFWTIDYGKYDDSGIPDGPGPNWTATPTNTVSVTATQTATNTATPTATPTATATPTMTATPTPRRIAYAPMIAGPADD